MIHISHTPEWSGTTAANSRAMRQDHSQAFQQFLDSSRDNAAPIQALSPETIRSLAANLMTALERHSMHILFSDIAASTQTHSQSADLLSTELLMAMRNPAPLPPTTPTVTPAAKSKSMTPPPVPTTNTDPSDMTKPAIANAQYAPLIERAAKTYGLDPKLITAVVQTESDFNAQAVSPVGAQGLMQLMPATAADLGVTDAFDPEQNIQAGSKYLKQLMDRYHGDTKLVLAAYNWGMDNIERNPERMPSETVNYVAKITHLINHAA